jgi:hypothetical protein
MPEPMPIPNNNTAPVNATRVRQTIHETVATFNPFNTQERRLAYREVGDTPKILIHLWIIGFLVAGMLGMWKKALKQIRFGARAGHESNSFWRHLRSTHELAVPLL